jgi:hypothetical protein
MKASQVGSPSVQSAVDLYAKALRASRSLFDLYPDPMPQGAPEKKFRGIPPAVVQGVTAAFEAFAEELVVIAMLRNRATWAQIAAHADMSNPAMPELCIKLKDAAGVEVKEPTVEGGGSWRLKIWTKPNQARWWQPSKELTWAGLLTDSKAWMQVRHCLTHGLVVGIEPAFWPGPVTRKAYSNQANLPTASSVLEEVSQGRRSLTMYPAINCGLTYSHGGAKIAEQVARAFGETANVGDLLLFDW